jgi:signal transduction histidine kinase
MLPGRAAAAIGRGNVIPGTEPGRAGAGYRRPVGNPVSRRLILLDGLAAAGFALLPGIAVLRPAGEAAWVWPLLAAGAVPLAVRRVWPVPVFAVVLAVSCAAAVGGPGSVPFLAAGYALYPVAVARPSRRWYSAAVVGGTGIAAAVAVTMVGTTFPGGDRAGPFVLGPVVLGLVVLAAAWAAGRAAGERRERARLATEEAVRHAQAQERLRIARELHDVVTHGMGLIAVQAGVANHVAGQRPQEARRALTVIESISRRSLRELRAMLGVLRGEAGGAGESAAERGRLRPSPGLADLPELVEVARAAGVPVELDAPGLDGVPDGVALSAYRIVQEALTNVVRHAAPTSCRVRVAAGPGRLSIDVEDEGRVAPAQVGPGRPHRDGTGLGLLGMRERAAAHAGTLAAGPRPGRGFAVSAVLYY